MFSVYWRFFGPLLVFMVVQCSSFRHSGELHTETGVAEWAAPPCSYMTLWFTVTWWPQYNGLLAGCHCTKYWLYQGYDYKNYRIFFAGWRVLSFYQWHNRFRIRKYYLLRRWNREGTRHRIIFLEINFRGLKKMFPSLRSQIVRTSIERICSPKSLQIILFEKD